MTRAGRGVEELDPRVEPREFPDASRGAGEMILMLPPSGRAERRSVPAVVPVASGGPGVAAGEDDSPGAERDREVGGDGERPAGEIELVLPAR